MDPVSLSLGAMRALGFLKQHRRALGYALAALAILGAFAFAAYKVDQYFDGVKATETARDSALAEAQRLGDRVKSLDSAIDANRRAYDFERAQLTQARKVAEAERDAANRRAASYERIRDAALSAPPEDRGPVSPVVRDTVDRLWGPSDPAAGPGPADHR